MKWPLIAAGVVCFALTQAFAQNFNASVSGFAQDSTQAYIPGVTVTATNTATGVTTTAITNESGAYNIQGMLPGTYKLTGELPGFRTQVFNDIQLGATSQRATTSSCRLEQSTIRLKSRQSERH